MSTPPPRIWTLIHPGHGRLEVCVGDLGLIRALESLPIDDAARASRRPNPLEEIGAELAVNGTVVSRIENLDTPCVSGRRHCSQDASKMTAATRTSISTPKSRATPCR